MPECYLEHLCSCHTSKPNRQFGWYIYTSHEDTESHLFNLNSILKNDCHMINVLQLVVNIELYLKTENKNFNFIY